MANKASSVPGGNGGSSGAAFTKCDFGTRILSLRPGSASSGNGRAGFSREVHMVHLGVGIGPQPFPYRIAQERLAIPRSSDCLGRPRTRNRLTATGGL